MKLTKNKKNNNTTKITKNTTKKNNGLCFRCEKRALFLETKGLFRMRYECGQVSNSVNSCYLYTPVKPCILKNIDKIKDRTPFGGTILGANCKIIGIPMCKLNTKKYNKNKLIGWWEPAE